MQVTYYIVGLYGCTLFNLNEKGGRYLITIVSLKNKVRPTPTLFFFL